MMSAPAGTPAAPPPTDKPASDQRATELLANAMEACSMKERAGGTSGPPPVPPIGASSSASTDVKNKPEGPPIGEIAGFLSKQRVKEPETEAAPTGATVAIATAVPSSEVKLEELPASRPHEDTGAMAIEDPLHEETDHSPNLDIAIAEGSIKVIDLDTSTNMVVNYTDRTQNLRSLPLPSGDIKDIETLRGELMSLSESKYPAALAIAKIMQSYGINVRSSVPDLGSNIPEIGPLELSGVVTKTVVHSQDSWSHSFEVAEDLKDLFGPDHVLLLYSHKTEPCSAPDGKSQLRCYHPKWTSTEER